jgi:hypothetical protein
MLDLEKLSPKELTAVTRQASQECALRLRRIAEASDPSDSALQGLLGKMAKEAQLQAQSLQEEDFSPRLSADRVREFIRASIPALGKRFGEGALHRDNALFYAESLEEEASRFYRLLAEHAREAKTRTFYTDLSDRERGKLRFLREVVLQS